MTRTSRRRSVGREARPIEHTSSTRSAVPARACGSRHAFGLDDVVGVRAGRRCPRASRAARRDRRSRSRDRASSRERRSRWRATLPTSALNRLDLPTFGAPTIATCSPSRTSRPRLALGEQRVGLARRSRRSRRASARRLDEVIALVGKIDRRLEPRDQIEQRRIESRDRAASACPAVDRTRRAPAAASPHRRDRRRLRPASDRSARSETRAA